MFAQAGKALNTTAAAWLTSRDTLIKEEELEQKAWFSTLKVIVADLERHSDARYFEYQIWISTKY